MALEKLEEQLNCSVCLDTYTDPRLLQCLHAHCKKCLVKLVDKDPQGQYIILCPMCRVITPLPAGGVTSLQSDFRINQLLDIVEEHKKAKDSSVAVDGDVRESTGTSQRSAVVFCSEHSGRKVELFCETCMELICLKCIVKEERHHNHDYEALDKAFDGGSVLEPMEKQLTVIGRAVKQLEDCCIAVSEQRIAIEANIHGAVGRLHEAIDVRKTELISKLHQITQAKLKSLAVQKDQVVTTQAQLSSCLHFMRENLKVSDEKEVVLLKRTTLKQVKELTATFQPNILLPNTMADVSFSISKDFTAMCQNYGRVLAMSSPDPSQCYATGKGVVSSVVGDNSSIVLQMLNCSGEPSRELTTAISCELVSELKGTKAKGSIKRRGHCQYDISYKPTTKGRHQLHVKVENQHIKGSPFSLIAALPVEELGTPILAIEGVERPDGIAISHAGNIVVSEGGVDCVSVFTPSGEKVRSFSMHGSGQGEISSPYQVAVDGRGNVLVTDRWNYRIQKFTVEGKFVQEVGTKGRGPLRFDCPYGIAYSPANDKVYVGDGVDGCIQILNSDLTYSSTFGRNGSDKGQFNDPRHIACDSAGNVYVADCHNHRIQVFTADGKFLRMFGRRGEGRGELDRPYGVAVDAGGMVYITEWTNHRVSVFTSEGHFIKCFGRQGDGPGEFRGPRGLVVDDSGVVYVCDFFNQHVHVF